MEIYSRGEGRGLVQSVPEQLFSKPSAPSKEQHPIVIIPLPSKFIETKRNKLTYNEEEEEYCGARRAIRRIAVAVNMVVRGWRTRWQQKRQYKLRVAPQGSAVFVCFVVRLYRTSARRLMKECSVFLLFVPFGDFSCFERTSKGHSNSDILTADSRTIEIGSKVIVFPLGAIMT